MLGKCIELKNIKAPLGNLLVDDNQSILWIKREQDLTRKFYKPIVVLIRALIVVSSTVLASIR